MKKHIFYLLIITLLLPACKEKEEKKILKESAFFIFYPRVCTHTIVSPAQLVKEDMGMPGKPYIINTVKTVNEEQMESKDFILMILTGADDLKTLPTDFPHLEPKDYYWMYQDPLKERYGQLAESIPKLEKQLEKDYRTQESRSSAASKSSYKDFPINLDYRVTGVKDFKVTALSPLFGIAAGESLNRFFSIYKFEPKQVISSQSKNLLWGYKDKSELNKIEQWLSMKPMAPPQMLLRLNTTPQEAPTEVQFVITLETNEGLVLSDTTKVNLK